MKNEDLQVGDFHRSVLMDDMLRVVGVDILTAIDVDGGQSYVRARKTCRACYSKAECRDWLAAHDQGAPQDFCSNADFFRSVNGDKP